MLSAIGGILSSSIFGTIIGLLGSWLTKREERNNLKIKLSHEIEMAKIRKDEAEIEFSHELALSDKKIERAQIEGKIENDIAETNAFADSLKIQSVSTGIVVLDIIRGIMRPLITVYLLIIGTILTVKISALVGGLESISVSEITLMYRNIIDDIMFLLSTAIAWYFGARPSGKRKDI